MALRRKKGSVIDRRLKQLDMEMAEVNSEVKAISNSGGFRVLEASRLKRGRGYKAEENRQAPGRQEEPSGKESGVSAEADLFGGVTEHGAGVDESSGMQGAEGHSAGWGHPLSSRADARVNEARMGREKFVNYFAAGHLQGLQPLRQENRVLRNKAIMMMVLVTLAAFWLFFFLR